MKFKNFRLSERTIRQLEELADKEETNQTVIIRRLINEAHAKETGAMKVVDGGVETGSGMNKVRHILASDGKYLRSESYLNGSTFGVSDEMREAIERFAAKNGLALTSEAAHE